MSHMLVSGLVVSSVLIFVAGMFQALSHRILFHPTSLPVWMQNDFWLFERGKLRRFKNFDPAQGERFLGSRTIFIALTNGYHLSIWAHSFLLVLGSALWAISVFFYADTLGGFIHSNLISLLFIYVIRCMGKYVIYATKRSSKSVQK